MTQFRTRTLLAAAIGLAVGLGAITTDASAQAARERMERNKERQQQQQEAPKQAPKYPAATRIEPESQRSAKLRKELNALIEAHNEGNSADALAKARALVANAEGSAYERSLAAQIGGLAAYEADDVQTAISLFQQAVELGGLDNNGHYDSMFMLAQLQLQEGQDQAGLATLDSLISETKSQNPQHYILKGNTLFNADRHAEAAAAVKQAIEMSDSPDPSWMQLLVGAYFELGQPQEAARIGEELLAKDPSDKRMQLNLATIYQQAGQLDKAAAMLERVRASGQLSDEKEYRQLYATYLNMEGKEGEAIAVIEDGLAKGVLKPSHEVYLALGQSYYFSGNDAKAIENYTRAAPLADDGETYLNLAKVLWQADRIAEAKRAAQQALDKGLPQPEEARKILALPN
jgi:tetratricopeptide (TPR) repeat protein